MTHSPTIPARSNGKHPGGRPSKYQPKYCQELIRFFSSPTSHEVEINHTNAKGDSWTSYEERPTCPPFFSAFARKIGVDDTTLDEWAKIHPEFSLAIKKARRLQEEHLVENGYKGLSQPAVTIFLLKNNHGYRDKHPDESPQVNVNVQLNVINGLKAIADRRKSRLAHVLESTPNGNGHTDAPAHTD